MRRGFLLACFGLVVFGHPACSSSSTNAGVGGGTNTGGAGAASGTGGGAGDASADAPVDTGTPKCDPNEQPDPKAVFVSPDGDDTLGSGSADKPLGTLGQAMKLAAPNSPALVILNQGPYPEKVSFDSATAGVALRGGFKRTGTVWERDCTATARAKTVIDSPSNIGVSVTDVKARLETLTVLTKAKGAVSDGAPGESMYGVFVTGDTASVQLVDVKVLAGTGGDGGPVTKVIKGEISACDGLTGCSDGAKGAEDTDGADAPLCSFDASGVTPCSGQDGSVGHAGHHGTDGKTATPQTGCMDQGCTGDCVSFCGTLGQAHSVTGAKGKCGCGGPGGDAGGGGWSGGASVALFVSGKGVVTAEFSELTSSGGGKGSAGSPGTSGGTGAPGTAGTPATCWGNCTKPATCGNCQQPSSSSAGGQKGGDGGPGGAGKAGGGGAGGPSIAIVRVGGALVTLSNGSVPTPGKAGLGGGAAPAGKSQAELVIAPDAG